MPEGDTIHKIANFLAPRLTSRRVANITMADEVAAKQCRSRRIEGVTARGKHLFIELDNHTALRSHLGMHGSWHRYAQGELWKKPRWQASLVISIDGDEYVCFNAKEIELVNLSSVRDRIVHSRLGPDLIADEVDFGELVRRARELLEEETLIADVLLDQRVASGIGNVYKSEVLFIERLMPDARLGDVSAADLERCFSTAADRLRRNLGGGRRITRLEDDGAGHLWVYGRTGLPCLRCAGRIVSRRLGKHHRTTYWCPVCQAR
ncbi:MAG: DNA-formamidopyrimidine glycosylase family protein [Gammaproteobacteria bacterium]